MNAIWSFLAITLIPFAIAADDFSKLWYDGNAEISTYRIKEMRYGEPRVGTRTMVFVTEPLRLATLVKPDNKLPDSLIVPVIKLNDIRQFNTGIYQYNVETSTFSAVHSRPGIPAGAAVKVAFSSQEWCGSVYERLIRDSVAYTGTIHSYFESEGDNSYAIKHENFIEPEENLWLSIRELRGPILNPGEKQLLRIIPSMWSRRKAHVPPSVLGGNLEKSSAGIINTAIGKIEANRFAWTLGDKTTEVTVESSYPHRILSWKEPDGSSGEIMASRREPYWDQHDNSNEWLRKELKLSSN